MPIQNTHPVNQSINDDAIASTAVSLNHFKQSKTAVINPPVLTPIQASKYLGIDTDTDALKVSRSTGELWGVPAPKFMKAGKKKVLYPVKFLDEFLSQFEVFSNNAEVNFR